MKKILCSTGEKITSIVFLSVFIISITSLTLFGISPILNSILNSAFYIILIVGLFSAISTIDKIGIRNFVGRSSIYFILAILLTFLNRISLDINFNFRLNEIIWFIVSILLILSLSMLLTTYRLSLPKTLLSESFLVFVISLFSLSLIAGWPQIINSLLITSGVIAIRISGKKTNCGIFSISIGLIILAVSNILFIQRYWSDIAYFGDISDVALLISWFSIVTGIYFIKRHHA